MEILMKFEGGCHCGEVKFEVLAPQKPIIIHCKYKSKNIEWFETLTSFEN